MTAFTRRLFLTALLLACFCLLPKLVSAHDGPPFALLVDQKVGSLVVSVWTDPDVGTGTFFVIVEPPKDGGLPNDLRIQVGVQPLSGRLQEAVYPANREDVRGHIQYKALVPFDAQEMWRVRVLLQSSAGSGELAGTVEATPPGFGRWDLLIYLVPFLAVAFLWLVSVKRKHFARTGKQQKELS